MEISIETIETLINNITSLQSEVLMLRGDIDKIKRDINIDNYPEPGTIGNCINKFENDIRDIHKELKEADNNLEINIGYSENKSQLNPEDTIITRLRRLEHELCFEQWKYEDFEKQFENNQTSVSPSDQYELNTDVSSYMGNFGKTIGYLFHEKLKNGSFDNVKNQVKELISEFSLTKRMQEIITEKSTKELVKQFTAEKAIKIFKDYFKLQQQELNSFKKEKENEIKRISKDTISQFAKIESCVKTINILAEELKYEKVLLDTQYF